MEITNWNDVLTVNHSASPIVEIMKPDEFLAKLKEIEAKAYDCEQSHINMDNLILDLLRSLGYGEGADFFDESQKWYS